MFFNKKIEVSVVIPVYGTENSLYGCLESVCKQDFLSFEIVVVDDASPGISGQLSVKDCLKKIRKAYKTKIRLVRHNHNEGLLEARRTGVYEAKGSYILFVDSDDSLPAGALSMLYSSLEPGIQIVQGSAMATGGKATAALNEKISKVHCGFLYNKNIFDGFLTKQLFNGYLWGKLFDRELLLNAYERIPFMYANMGEDFIQSFWITYFATGYKGINHLVYNYSISTGITSGKAITELNRWEQVCSTASVFSGLFVELEEQNIKLTEEQNVVIRRFLKYFAQNNYRQLETVVDKSIKSQAYDLLCQYWGKSFIEKIKAQIIQDEPD